MFKWTFDIHWWHVLLIGVAFLVASHLLLRRRRWLAGLATISVTMALTAAILWPLSWGRGYGAGIGEQWGTNDGFRSWAINLSSKYGGLRAMINRTADINETGETGSRQPFPLQAATYSENTVNYIYPTWGGNSSITHWDFLEKTLGFQICWANYPPEPGTVTTIGLYSITVPHWFILLLCLPFPLLWLRRYRRRRYRLGHGLCPACGYDLRASSGKCPECGADAGKGEGVAAVASGAKTS